MGFLQDRRAEDSNLPRLFKKNAPQDMGIQDPMPPAVGQPAQVEGFKPKFSQQLFGYDEPAKQDTLGVDLPTEHHQGAFKTILDYALPALVGLGGGVGAIPGLASAFAGNRTRDDANDKLGTEQYLKRHESARLANQAAVDDARQSEALGETKNHNQKLIDLGWGKINAAKNKPSAVGLQEKAIKIEQDYRTNPSSVPPEDVSFLKAYYRMNKTKANDPPDPMLED